MNSPDVARPARVEPTPVGEVAALLGITAPAGGDRVRVTGITHDSRAVRDGDVYAALPGARAHGAEFAGQAAAAGAVAVLTDPAGRDRAEATGLPVLVTERVRDVLGDVAALVYGNPGADLLLLGVTGTNGKTTTAYLLEAGLRAAGHRTGLVGGVEILVDGEAQPSVRTTPESTDLQALFAVMRERAVTAAAMEVSSHALSMGRVGGARFDVAAFTNLSQDHLDFHADLEDYFAAKAQLFTPASCGRAVVCVDDEFGRRLAAQVSVPVATLTAAEAAGTPAGSQARQAADWQVRDVVPEAGGRTSFTLLGPDVELATSVALPGRFNVANAALAVAVLHAAGVDPVQAADGVAALPGVPGRMERIEAGQPYLAVVDYAHTPSAVATLLDALRPQTKGRLVVLLGAGGDRDAGKRPLMGEQAARGADLVVVTDDNPRSEDPAEIRDAVTRGALAVPAAARGEVVTVPGRREAIMEAVRRAGPDDTLVLAGKGHETGQEVAGVVHPFDDRTVLRAAIAEVYG